MLLPQVTLVTLGWICSSFIGVYPEPKTEHISPDAAAQLLILSTVLQSQSRVQLSLLQRYAAHSGSPLSPMLSPMDFLTAKLKAYYVVDLVHKFQAIELYFSEIGTWFSGQY